MSFRLIRTVLTTVAMATLASCTCSGSTEAPEGAGGARKAAGPPAKLPRTEAKWAGDGMPAGAAVGTIQLDRTPATWSYPPSNLPKGRSLDGEFDLPDLAKKEGAKGDWFAATPPFTLPPGQKKVPPAGMEVIADGKKLPIAKEDPGAVPDSNPSWRIFNNQIAVCTPTQPSKVTVVWPGAHQFARRLNRETAREDNLTDDAAFASYALTLGPITRDGLLVNAPTTATWSNLTLPAGARFDGWLAMVSAGADFTSDGASISLVVRADGAEEVIATQEIAGKTDDFVRFQADLAKFSGKTVDVLFRTTPGASAEADHVFVGSPTITGKQERGPRHVFVIGIDTTRPDHFGVNGYSRDTTPELDRWSQDAVIFDRAWTSAPRTRPSFRAATTGRLPLEAVCAPNIGEAFSKAGFATAGIVSNIHLNPHFDFNDGFDMWWLDGKAQVNDQVKRALDWMEEQGERDTYMFLHIMDPHIFYKAPDPYGDRFVSELPPLPEDEALPKMFNRWNVYKWQKAGKLSELRKQHITAQYDGELAFTSHHLGRLLAAIDKLPGENLVIIHNDHGEEMWEHDGFEHNHTLYNDVTGGLLWIKPPGGTGQAGAHSSFPATLQDMAPTLYAFAGIDGFASDGANLLDAIRGEADSGWTRPIPIGHLQYGASRWGVVWQDHKYVLWTGSGEEELYDLVADPAEKNNLIGKKDPAEWVSRLGPAHKMEAGAGWRITVDLEKNGPVTVTLPGPVAAADVLDPEYMSQHPANQEWGEVPKKLPEDVGVVTLADDRRSFKIQPGKNGQGVIYVLFKPGEPLDLAAAEVASNGGEGSPDAQGHLALGATTLDFKAGVVVVPPRPEHERMADCASTGAMSDAEMKMLEAMGYIHKADPKAED